MLTADEGARCGKQGPLTAIGGEPGPPRRLTAEPVADPAAMLTEHEAADKNRAQPVEHVAGRRVWERPNAAPVGRERDEAWLCVSSNGASTPPVA